MLLSGQAPTDPKTPVDAYAFGAGNVDLFVGSGPYFVDSNHDGVINQLDTPDSSAVGLALSNVNFGLVVMKPKADRTKTYMALKSTAGFAGLVGINDFKLSASAISVQYNTVKGSGVTSTTPVVDFNASFPAAGQTKAGYALDTGNGTLQLDYSTKLLRASVATAVLQIGSNVFVHGGLAFEKGPDQTVTLTGNAGTRTVSTITVGAAGLSMFFGANGPYVSDTNGDGVIDSNDATNPNATGLAITNANLALALLKDKNSTTRYIGLKATADQVGLVGTGAFQLSASTIAVDLDLATGTGVTSATPVVNFIASFPDPDGAGSLSGGVDVPAGPVTPDMGRLAGGAAGPRQAR